MKVVWHKTAAGLNLYLDGKVAVLPEGHPDFKTAERAIEEQDDETLSAIIGAARASADTDRVTNLLGIKPSSS